MVSERGMIEKNYWSSSKIPVIIWKKIEFLDRFKKKTLKNQISWKSIQWEPSCFIRTDGRTDRKTYVTHVIVAVRSFAKAQDE